MTKSERSFNEILGLIENARYNALKSVNSELITLYWNIGEHISKKVEREEWGKHTIENLAKYLIKIKPGLCGFSAPNLWRMKQFYETYQGNIKLSTVLRELHWSSHLHILSKTKSMEEKEFYIHLSIKERYSVRELERQINSCYYERTMLSKQKVAPAETQNEKVAVAPRELENVFKDTYVLEFLDLPENFSEKDFRKAIIGNFKKFILEFGKDFAFIGEEYKVQVGSNDYLQDCLQSLDVENYFNFHHFIDLLFFHRGLRCLVAFELKIDEFKPEYLGKMNFYLNVLDSTIRNENENPSVGVILCKDKDKEVVRFSFGNNISSALVAKYKIELDSRLLGNKFKELVEMFER